MMKIDLHLHTSRHSPDSIMTPEELITRAVEMGLDGVVITEHDWLWTEPELEELRGQAKGLLILAGIEVTTRDGDLLVYGVRNPFALPRGIRMADACREIHRQGGACVAAHPYRWGQDFDRILREHRPELDGLEMMSNNMDAELRRKARACQERHPHLAGLGNSDAHDVRTLGICYTLFDADIRTTADLVAAIRERKCNPIAR